MELFLLCSDDAESDVRMVADECLNKVIKVSTPWTASSETRSLWLRGGTVAWHPFGLSNGVL